MQNVLSLIRIEADRGKQHYHRMSHGPIQGARDRRRGTPFDDVTRRVQARIDPPSPSLCAAAEEREFKLQGFAVGVQNHMEAELLSRDLGGKRQAMGTLPPIGLPELYTVP
jgi:hypothetical protein